MGEKNSTNSNPELSVVVPVYNEQDVFKEFASNLSSFLSQMNITWEIIWVNDGSQDNTFEQIYKIADKDNRHHGISFSRNFGKESAILAGLEYSSGNGVVVMDGDGQHPVELLSPMYNAWKRGEAEIIAAKKTNRSSNSFLSRGFAHVFNKLMNKTTGMDFSGASDYIFMDRDVVNAIISSRERVRFFRGLAKWAGFSQIEIPFEVPNRLNGTSKWSIKKLISLSIDAMTGFTYQPLIWVFGSGIIGLVISLLLGIQALYSWIMDIAISGWTSLTVIILFFGSANLLSIGIVGLYLARIFEEVKLRPHFIIREVTNKLSKK
jgi:polyisoprenyl-phosphate glycosyltransferase